MGSSVSTNAGSAEEQEVNELERRLQASGDLPFLQQAFSHLSVSVSGSRQQSIPLPTLQESFDLAPLYVTDNPSATHSTLAVFVAQLGQAITGTFFETTTGQVDWPLFLQGYDKCCKQGLGAVRLKILLSLFVKGSLDEPPLPGLHIRGDEELTGSVTISQIQDLLWLCWLMSCHARLQGLSGSTGTIDQKILHVSLPDIKPLCISCYVAATGNSAELAADLKSKEEISVEKLCSWVLATISSISDCLAKYVQAHLRRVGTVTQGQREETAASKASPPVYQTGQKEGKEDSKETVNPKDVVQPGLLTLGTAWAVGLSQRDSSGMQLVNASCDPWGFSNSYPSLIYRASDHGRGMNRFWTRVEGYRGPVLIMIAVVFAENSENELLKKDEKCVVGAIVSGGFENKELFYGSSTCCLLSVVPQFAPLRSTGKETNFVYSHKRTPGSIYRTQPKPEGIGFGGSSGKERLWLDDDFSWLTVQHHAVDKTYQSGSLVPGQGYAHLKGKVTEVEVWGLGGAAADKGQAVYQHRENLFTEQRRKVDLKNFGNWSDSPEKLMLDMVSDPAKAPREER